MLVAGTPYAATYYNVSGEWILRGLTGAPGIPLGVALPYFGVTAPSSAFALPFGQAISRTTYVNLFNLIATTYSAGDGSTTFNLPDLRGYLLAGKDDMGGTSRAYEVMAFFSWYGTDHLGRNNASPRCQWRVCNESDCCPDTYSRQPLPHVIVPGSLARPARHLLARGLGRGEVRFRRSENAPRCRPAPLLPYSTRKPAIKL